MEAFFPTMMTGQGRAVTDGSLGAVFRDGVLGSAYRDGSLGQAGAYADGSLGSGAAPTSDYRVNPLQQKMRMMRARLSGLGSGAAPVPSRYSPAYNHRFRTLQLQRRLGLRGLGEDEADVSVNASTSVKLLGLLAVVGLGAYGIYRVTQK